MPNGDELIRTQVARAAIRQRLCELEQIISKGMATFIEVGKALLEIRNKRLYREQGYSTFEDYCRKRWNWSRRHVNRQIQAVEVVAITGPTGPKRERQARELTGLKPEEIKEVADQVDFSTATAKDVRAVVRKVRKAEEPATEHCSVDRWLIDRVIAMLKDGLPEDAEVQDRLKVLCYLLNSILSPRAITDIDDPDFIHIARLFEVSPTLVYLCQVVQRLNPAVSEQIGKGEIEVSAALQTIAKEAEEASAAIGKEAEEARAGLQDQENA